MANSRADEMVLAGAAPTPAPGSDPVAHVHRGTSFIVLVDGAIVVFSSYLLIGVLFSGIVVDVLLGGLMLTTLLIYAGYKNRKPWAYWPAVGILISACLVFIGKNKVSARQPLLPDSRGINLIDFTSSLAALLPAPSDSW